MNNLALKELLYKIADDQLIIGHRNGEWTGIGPILEEDIAFASMAQDKVGQSRQLYQLLNELGEQEPDVLAFMRNASQFHNSQFTELPIGEYDFSLVRHFLFDCAELLRFEMLKNSSYQPLSQLSAKIYGEIKYHFMHGRVWLKSLGGSADEEATARMQNSLKYALPYALGMFETSEFEADIIAAGIFEGEEALKTKWIKLVTEQIAQTNLELPDLLTLSPVYGGRKGTHTQYLQPLLDEMSEVFRLDPTAEW